MSHFPDDNFYWLLDATFFQESRRYILDIIANLLKNCMSSTTLDINLPSSRMVHFGHHRQPFKELYVFHYFRHQSSKQPDGTFWTSLPAF